MLLNTAATGAFDSINVNQEFTVGFWMSGDDTQGVNNESVFWATGIAGQTDRAFQAHIPWSDDNVYFDVGGCCGPTQRTTTGNAAHLTGDPIGPESWRASAGEEWTHWAFTIEPDFGDASVYVNGEERLFREGPTSEIPELAQIWIGAATGGGNFFGGRLDDFFIADEALSAEQIAEVVADGVRSVFSNLPAEPDLYTPEGGAEGRLVNMNGKLAGAAYLPGGDVTNWHVEQIFHATAGGQDIEAVADLSSAGVAGTGNVGDANTNVQLGDVDLVNTGADDKTYEFNLVVNFPGNDPILGAVGQQTFSQTFTIPGTGGEIDPFILLGDLDQDGTVGFSDFVIMAANYGAVKPAAAPSVPEPASALLLLLAGGMLVPILRRRA
jgi:hypothetical protein